MKQNCFKWSNQLEEDNIIMSYKGDFNSDLVNSILSLTYKDAHIRQSKDLVKNRLFSVIVESLQNVYKHGKVLTDDDEGVKGIFLVRKTDQSYCIYTGNFLSTESVNTLKQKIDQVRLADHNELVELQKNVLKNGELSPDGCAGIGLIEIGKKSSQIEYTFDHLEDQVSFFSLEAEISTTIA